MSLKVPPLGGYVKRGSTLPPARGSTMVSIVSVTGARGRSCDGRFISLNVFINKLQEATLPTKSSACYSLILVKIWSCRFCGGFYFLESIDRNIV